MEQGSKARKREGEEDKRQDVSIVSGRSGDASGEDCGLWRVLNTRHTPAPLMALTHALSLLSGQRYEPQPLRRLVVEYDALRRKRERMERRWGRRG